MRAVFTAIALSLISSLAHAQSNLDSDKIRFGLGFAQLVAEQCPGYRTGPQFDQMMRFLRAGAKVSGKPFDEAQFLAETKVEAASKMQGQDICEAAAQVADPKGIVAPVR